MVEATPQPTRRERVNLFTTETVSAAIALDATSTSGFLSAAGSATWSHTCSGSDRVLAMGETGTNGIAGNRVVSAVTYNSDALTLISVQENSPYRQEMWYMTACDVGTFNLFVDWVGSITGAAMGVSITGVDQTTPIDSFSGQIIDNVSSLTTSWTATTSDTYTIDVINGNSSVPASIAAQNGVTELIETGGGFGMGIEQQVSTSINNGWNDDGNAGTPDWEHIGVAFTTLQPPRVFGPTIIWFE